MRASASTVETVLNVALIVLVVGFTIAFSSLVYGAVQIASSTADVGFMMTTWTYVLIEILFISMIFWMSYTIFKKGTGRPESF